MPRFAANLSLLYPEHAFLDRFAAAADDGFQAVEFLFPYACSAAAVAQKLGDRALAAALFNAPAGDFEQGERGLAALPGRQEAFRRSIDQALEYAAVIRPRCLHIMAGIVRQSGDVARHREVYLENLAWAAAAARGMALTLTIEPINRRDIPGYFLNTQAEAHALVAEVGAPNLAVQMDFYHCQISEGDLTRRFEQYAGQVAHIQIAGVPDRNEPDTGEVNYRALFAAMDAAHYTGWIGCEYRPRDRLPGGTTRGLGWREKLCG
jgi:hydroxypyruvate isomerase